jgi:hypothetical protein
MNNFWKIFEAILGTAEQIVPIFIHNPKSGQIEGVIVSTLNSVLAGVQEGVAAQAVSSASGSTATVQTTTTVKA